MKPRHIDMTGQRFGRLVCLDFVDSTDNGLSRWKVRCDCGTEFIAYRVNLITGHTISCGCIRSERCKTAWDRKKAQEARV